MAFVVPAEIGHATYSTVLLECLCRNFGGVGIIAVREKLFPELSEDVWLLHCTGFGGRTESLGLSVTDRFQATTGSPHFERAVTLSAWRAAGCRLRKFLLSSRALALYDETASHSSVRQLSEVAHAGIGYVTGANDFFHLRPSEAKLWDIPRRCLKVAVRKAEQLPSDDVNDDVVREWLRTDDPVLFLDLTGEIDPPESVKRYLGTADGERAKRTYKCSNRKLWFVVPDVRTPDAFLSYMSGESASLVANSAGCVCTNSVHAVRLKNGATVRQLQQAWKHPLAQLSCELEGHPLGGGMLKLEPGEAARTRLPLGRFLISKAETDDLIEATQTMRRWRHYG